MKRKNIILVATIIALISAFTFCLAGCASTDLTKLVNGNFVVPGNAATQTEIKALDGYTVGDIDGAMAIVEKDGIKSLFSFKNNKFIVQDKPLLTNSTFFYTVNATDETKVDVYSHSGVVVTCKLSDMSYDSITVDDKVYMYNEDADLAVEAPKEDFVPEGNGSEFETNTLKVEAYQTGGKRFLLVFDKNSKAYKHSICLNDYIVDSPICSGVLANGDYLVQEVINLPEDAKSYDLISDGTKYDLNTKVINLETGKAKDIKTDFVIDDISSNIAIGADFFAEDINVINYRELEGKVLTERYRVQAVDSKLKVKIDLQKIMPGATDLSVNYDGSLRISDGLDVMNYKDASTSFKYNKSSVNTDNRMFLTTDKAVYDLYGKKILDQNAYKKFDLEKITTNGIILFTYEDKDGNVIPVAKDKTGAEKVYGKDCSFVGVYYNSYAIKNAEGKISVYYDNINAPMNSTPIETTNYYTSSYSIGETFNTLFKIGTKYFVVSVK